MKILLTYSLICVTLFHGLRNGRCFSMLKNAKWCILDTIINMKTEYLMGGVKLEPVNEEKDLALGVIISEVLKSEKQRISAVSKANRIL